MAMNVRNPNTYPKLSKASKMPCQSWSLEAIVTCPGSKGPDGELVDACRGCYATTGNYRFPNVKAPREHNKQNWQRASWVADMVAAIGNDPHFRWFDSGDMYSLPLANKILNVMMKTPGTMHWLPTRMHKFNKFADVIARMEALPNVVVRLSSDSVTGETVDGRTTSTIIPTPDHAPVGAFVCGAYERDGKCGDCRACWSSDHPVIAYPAHGKKMAKLISTMEII